MPVIIIKEERFISVIGRRRSIKVILIVERGKINLS